MTSETSNLNFRQRRFYPTSEIARTNGISLWTIRLNSLVDHIPVNFVAPTTCGIIRVRDNRFQSSYLTKSTRLRNLFKIFILLFVTIAVSWSIHGIEKVNSELNSMFSISLYEKMPLMMKIYCKHGWMFRFSNRKWRHNKKSLVSTGSTSFPIWRHDFPSESDVFSGITRLPFVGQAEISLA